MTGKYGSYTGSPTDLGTQGISATFTTHRTLDPVRAAALAAAVQHSRWLDVDANPDHVGAVLAVAARFEAYLTGEEAHDPTAPS